MSDKDKDTDMYLFHKTSVKNIYAWITDFMNIILLFISIFKGVSIQSVDQCHIPQNL